MKQPELGDDIAPLAMAAWQASATDGARCAIPGCAEAPQLLTARQSLRHKLGDPGKEIDERIGIAGERRPESPGMGGEHMHAFSPRREHAPDLAVHAREIRHVLEHIRREHHIRAGVRQGDSEAVVIDDRKQPVGGVVRIRNFNGGDLEPAPQLERRLPVPAPISRTRACRKTARPARSSLRAARRGARNENMCSRPTPGCAAIQIFVATEPKKPKVNGVAMLQMRANPRG
jgi:hypothetical protein